MYQPYDLILSKIKDYDGRFSDFFESKEVWFWQVIWNG